jgi:hypothetical protein
LKRLILDPSPVVDDLVPLHTYHVLGFRDSRVPEPARTFLAHDIDQQRASGSETVVKIGRYPPVIIPLREVPERAEHADGVVEAVRTTERPGSGLL